MNRIACILLSLLVTQTAIGGPLGPGDVAPNWVLMNQQGKPTSLYQIVDSGRPAVMVFCASWCDRCKQFVPRLRAITQSSGAETVMLNVWDKNDAAKLIGHSQPGIDVMLHADTVARRFGIEMTPGVVVVNRQRRISFMPPPTTDIDQLSLALKRALDKL